MKNKIIAVLTIFFFTALVIPGPALAVPPEETSRLTLRSTFEAISPLSKGQKAPFEGILFSKDFAAKIEAERKTMITLKLADVRTKAAIALTRSELQLKLDIMSGRNAALEDKHVKIEIFIVMEKMRRRIVESSAGGHTDIAYGIYDRPGPDDFGEEIFEVEPIIPQDQMSVQLSVARPPVEDPDYLPGNNKSLGLSLSALSSSIPDEKIQKFYRYVRDKAEELIDGELMNSNQSAGESVMESKIKKMIAEVLDDEFGGKDLAQMQKDFDEEFGADDKAASVPQAPPEEVSLEKIASDTGFSGPSGAKNFLYRMLSRMARFVDVPKDEIDALVDFAAGEYVDVLLQGDLIDEEDAKYMEANKSVVADLPSFKYFIGTAIAGPALKELERSGKKKVSVFLDKLNLSDSTKNTVLNQLMGQVPKNRLRSSFWKNDARPR